jgi:N-acetylneuraminic acid mutarotase
MIVWGGYDGSSYLYDGRRYNPAKNIWTAVATSGTPSRRGSHTAVWTGNEMIVWGGKFLSGSFLSGSFLNDGGRYNPMADSWTAVTTDGAPAGRYYHSAVWTGSEMIVWGGFGDGILNDGSRYNPAGDSCR